jgi:hypothetical protein
MITLAALSLVAFASANPAALPATAPDPARAAAATSSGTEPAAAAAIEEQGKGKGKGKSQAKARAKGREHAGPEDDERLAASIDRDRCRERASAYYSRHGLPPGLAKRESLPPGLEKQLRERGQLPPGLEKHLASLPPGLAADLPPLPPGYGWRLLGNDLIALRLGANVIAAFIPGVFGTR